MTADDRCTCGHDAPMHLVDVPRLNGLTPCLVMDCQGCVTFTPFQPEAMTADDLRDRIAKALSKCSNGATYIHAVGEVRCKDCDAFLSTANNSVSSTRISALHRAHVADAVAAVVQAELDEAEERGFYTGCEVTGMSESRAIVRAVKAEAERDEARAALAALRDGIKALADEWEANGIDLGYKGEYGSVVSVATAALRALLGEDNQ